MGKKQKAILRTQAEKDALRIATGRPTKYDPSVIDKFTEYFSKPPYQTDAEGRPRANDFPSLAGFAISIGIDRTTLKRWADENEDFCIIYKKAKEYQENYLMVNGTKGLIQQPITIFALKNYADMTDKKEIEHKGEINSVVTVQPFDLDARKKQLKGEE